MGMNIYTVYERFSNDDVYNFHGIWIKPECMQSSCTIMAFKDLIKRTASFGFVRVLMPVGLSWFHYSERTLSLQEPCHSETRIRVSTNFISGYQMRNRMFNCTSLHALSCLKLLNPSEWFIFCHVIVLIFTSI